MTRSIIFVTFLTALFACTPQSKTASNEAGNMEVRIIVALNNLQQDPKDPGFIQSLEKDLNAKLTFLQKASGNAAVYQCKTPASKDVLVNALNKLGSRADINYAEVDEKRHIQPNNHY